MQRNRQRTRWLALAAACAVAGVVLVLVGVLRGDGSERPRPDAIERDTATSPAPRVRAPESPAGSTEVRLAPVVAETRTAPDRTGAAEISWSAPDAPPAPDRLRILGRVVDENGEPIATTGAVVSVTRDSDWTDATIVLGRVPVAANGRFWIDVPPHRHGNEVYLQLVAPGYEWADAEVGSRDFDDNVANVTLETSRGGLYVRGRVLDARGAPVVGAEVRVVEWGAQGRDLASHELETASDGIFESEIGWIGWVDALAHHPCHGLAKGGRRLEAGQAVLDLGDLTLTPTSIVSGIVRGRGGALIPRADVMLVPANDFSGAGEQEVTSDADGRFRFAALEAIPYHVMTEFEEREAEDCPIVVPDVVDLVLEVPFPTATVTTLDPSGRAFDADGLKVAPIPDQPNEDDLWSNVERFATGQHRVVFGGAGRYRLIARHEQDDIRWFATSDVEVRRAHVEVTLRLAPPKETEMRFEVARASGAAAHDWFVRVRDPATRAQLGYATERGSTCRLPPGTWVAHVSPGAQGVFRPFKRTFRVPDDGSEAERTIEFTAEVDGGRVEVVLQSTRTGLEGAVSLSIHPRGKTSTSFFDPSWQFRGEPRLIGTVLPEGAYTLKARPIHEPGDASTRSADFDVVAGRVARVHITVP
ncbi:MAG: carboxypeptidase-like regulatory domain-containing protein [Planctomycetota bacterium]